MSYENHKEGRTDCSFHYIVSNLHLGGGVLKILVADILRVDGIITADSKDMALSGESSASSGGSGGSVWIETGAFIGKDDIHKSEKKM